MGRDGGASAGAEGALTSTGGCWGGVGVRARIAAAGRALFLYKSIVSLLMMISGRGSLPAAHPRGAAQPSPRRRRRRAGLRAPYRHLAAQGVTAGAGSRAAGPAARAPAGPPRGEAGGAKAEGTVSRGNTSRKVSGKL